VILTPLDWVVIALYFALSLVVGLVYTRRAGESVEEYFLSDRKLPWWLAGTSMVATTFAADTPLAVTGLTVKHGIAGNWLYLGLFGVGELFVGRPWRGWLGIFVALLLTAWVLRGAEAAEIE